MRQFYYSNATSTTKTNTLSLHDALPISIHKQCRRVLSGRPPNQNASIFPLKLPSSYFSHRSREAKMLAMQHQLDRRSFLIAGGRSEEHTSELQSPYELVCRLLLEKKKKE